MKKLSLLAGILILFTTAVRAQTPDAPKAVVWQNYTVKDEKFSVAIPILPAVHLNTRYREGWEKKRKIIQIGSYADGVVYTVFVLENPSPKQELKEFIAERIGSGSPANFESERSITRDGVTGKAFSYANADDGMSQFFVSGDRLYEFRAIGAAPDDARVSRFFSSLSFGKIKDAVELTEGPGLPFEVAPPPGTADDEAARKAFVGKEVTRKVRLGMKPEPSYTEAARQYEISGTVILKCVFRSNGSVTDIRTVSGLPYGLTDRAIQAAKRIKFIPAMKDGKYVSMWMQLEYNFNPY